MGICCASVAKGLREAPVLVSAPVSRGWAERSLRYACNEYAGKRVSFSNREVGIERRDSGGCFAGTACEKPTFSKNRNVGFSSAIFRAGVETGFSGGARIGRKAPLFDGRRNKGTEHRFAGQVRNEEGYWGTRGGSLFLQSRAKHGHTGGYLMSNERTKADTRRLRDWRTSHKSRIWCR